VPACNNCGEVFDEGKLVCPQCGADADFTYAEEPNEFDFSEAEESPKTRAGCAVFLFVIGVSGGVCGSALLLI